MRAQIIRSAAARSMEVTVAVVLVLVFFSVLLGLLNTLFPLGSSLKELMSREGLFSPAGLVQESVRELLFSSRGQEFSLTEPGSLAAVLTQMRNEVKSKRSDGIAWMGAREGMPLYDRDAIQTLRRASATITFDERSSLDMGQNSLVIIQRLEEDPLLRQKRVFLVMVDGELRGRIGQSDEKSVHVKVATHSAVTRIRSRQSTDGQAEFKITVNPDNSSTVALYHGVADVTAQGQTVRVEANQAATVNPEEPPMPPEPLPEPPALISPEKASVFYYRDLPPRILFKWAAAAGMQGYNFVLARDPMLRNIVYEEKLARPHFIHGNLKKGNYYWRVSGLEESREGAFSETWQLQIVQDRMPPQLDVHFPPKTVDRDRYVLVGKTGPGARVFVGGKQVSTTETGAFKHSLQLKHGINVIVVEAVDKVGNVSYRSQLVNAKF